MVQFDPLIIFPLVSSLVLTLTVYSRLSIDVLIPQFMGIGKFREKKRNSLGSFNLFNTSSISKVSKRSFLYFFNLKKFHLFSEYFIGFSAWYILVVVVLITYIS